MLVACTGILLETQKTLLKAAALELLSQEPAGKLCSVRYNDGKAQHKEGFNTIISAWKNKKILNIDLFGFFFILTVERSDNSLCVAQFLSKPISEMYLNSHCCNNFYWA